MNNESKSSGSRFRLLTEKQSAVLELLARGLTSKEIGYQLGASESAVNRHIEILRSRFGDITRLQLARLYRESPDEFPRMMPAASCVETTEQKIDLAEPEADEGRKARDETEAQLAFQDSLTVRIDAPWTKPEEPGVVPRVLDGENATLTRGTAIAVMLLAIIASLARLIAARISSSRRARAGRLPGSARRATCSW